MSASRAVPAPERRAWLFLAALTLLACACRIPLLLHGIWRDEGDTFFDVTAPTLAGTLREISRTELTPPGFFIAMRGWVALFGTSEIALKLPAFVFGAALAPATYALARLLGSRGVALLAAGFAAFSLGAIGLSTEARAYTLGALLGAIAIALALRYLSSAARPGMLLGYVAVAMALTYVHYTGLVLVVALALGCTVFAAQRAALRRLILFEGANAIVALAIAPWLPHAAGARNATFLERSGGSGLGRFVEQAGFVLPVDFMHVQYAFLFIVALAVVVVRYVSRGSREGSSADARLAAAALALLVGIGIESGLSLHEQRYMFAFTPLANGLAAALCFPALAQAFAWIRERKLGKGSALRATFGGALLVSALTGFSTEARAFARVYGNDRSGVRRLVADVFPALDRRTLVVIAPDYLAPTVGYYLRARPDLTIVGVPQWNAPEHPRCCPLHWSDPAFVDALGGRIVAALGGRYSSVAYVWDENAYDEGPVAYSKVFELRSRLARALSTRGERSYDGSKERVGIALFDARTH